MIDRPSLLKIGRTAEKFRVLSEQRREDFAQLFRSGRWRRYYELDDFVVRAREVAEMCDRWAEIVEQYRKTVPDLLEPPPINRDAA